jgi:hypothetical protein
VTIRVCCPGTNSGGSSLDRFGPTIIVGNVAEGDSPTAYAQNGFVYIPDPGDGTGIAAAIAALNSPGSSGGSIHIRRGIYDFSTPTSPALPLLVNGWITIEGDGNHATQIYTPYQGVPTLFRIGAVAPNPVGRSLTIGNLYVYSYHVAGGTYPPNMSPSIIDFPDLQAFGRVYIHDIRAEADWYDPLAPLRSFFSVRSGHTVVFERCEMTCFNPQFGNETDWHRAFTFDGGITMSVTVRDCTVTNFDAVVVVGEGRSVTLDNILVPGFRRRFVHQEALLSSPRITINGGFAEASDASAIGLDLASTSKRTVKVSDLSLSIGYGANDPGVRIRSFTNGGHAKFVNCEVKWQRANGASFEIGTNGSNDECDRNMISNCFIRNSDPGGIAVRIFNASVLPALGSRNNIVVGNSLEANTPIIDANPGLNQVALNV